MKKVPTFKSQQIFEEVPDQEVERLNKEIHEQSVAIFGRSRDDAGFIFRPHGRPRGFVVIGGGFRVLPKESNDSEGTFSFDLDENKYLFRAKLVKNSEQQGELHRLTPIYKMQRRAMYRLSIPSDFYAVVRITHINAKKVGAFAKLSDISGNGMGLWYSDEAGKIEVGDSLNVVLNIRQRPAENLELKVTHCRSVSGGLLLGPDQPANIILGTRFATENSLDVLKKMNHIVMEIYRDLFGSFFAA